MKKIALFAVALGLLYSCGTSKTVKTSKKVIKGTWVLDKIDYSDYGTFRISFFNDTTKPCLEGGKWNFIPNNNTGTYSLSGESCATDERYFIFKIDEVDPVTGLYDFLLKPTNAKGKSPDNKGFRMRLLHLSETNMKWEQKSSIDGKTISMIMNFNKINE